VTFGRRIPERRRTPRERVQIKATIEYGGASPQKCFIINLSQTGALLEVTSILGVPDQFQLRVAGQGSWRVEVKRRTPSKLAVVFVR
jgi:hypothetical protein